MRNVVKKTNSVPLSVFMPVFNTEEYLPESIESILAQTYSDYEFIIINDGSTDHSLDVIQHYAKLDSRIKYFTQENEGRARTRNIGLEKCKGDYVALMDSDDICHPIRLKEQVDYLNRNIDYGACGTAIKYFGDRRKLIKKYSKDYRTVKINLLFSCAIANPSSMFRRNIIQKHGIRYKDTDLLAQDYRFWVRFSRVSKITNLDLVLYFYRWHPMQGSRAQANKQRSIADEVVHEQLNELKIFVDSSDVRLFRSATLRDKAYLSSLNVDTSLEKFHTIASTVLHKNEQLGVYDQKLLVEKMKSEYQRLCLLLSLEGVGRYLTHKELFGSEIRASDKVYCIIRYINRLIGEGTK